MAIKYLVFSVLFIAANTIDQTKSIDSLKQGRNLKFKCESLIVPSILITYGFIGIESDGLKLFNTEIREELNEHIDTKFTIDDISQYAPFAAVYVLDL